MAGLVPAIHAFFAAVIQDVDARVKPGHDAAFPAPTPNPSPPLASARGGRGERRA